MIIVIADDFSGAAEIGGIGLRYGLRSTILTGDLIDVDSDILIIDSNTRSVNKEEAGLQIKKITEQLQKFSWDWIYKKTDSVLRGYVLTELTSLLRNLEKQSALLIPQNPGAGRVITDGNYFINDTPLHLTKFSSDPDFPVKTSNVLSLLGNSDDYMLQILTPGSQIEKKSGSVGTAASENDLNIWAKQLKPETIPAGGSDFFNTILKYRGKKLQPVEPVRFVWEDKNILIICGSASGQYKQLIKKTNRADFIVCNMPCAVGELDAHQIQLWQDNIVKAFNKSCKVVVTINQKVEPVPEKLGRLTDVLAEITGGVLKLIQVDTLFIEGGDTASGILRFLGWKRLIPIEEWGSGVIRMKIPGEPAIKLTTKPGSYPWPDKLLTSFPSCTWERTNIN